MDHDAHRRVDGEGDRIGHAVVDADGSTSKTPILIRSFALILHILGALIERCSSSFFFTSPGQRRPIDRGMNFLQHPGQRPDMILVPVGQNNPLHLILILYKIGDIGDDESTPGRSSSGKASPQSTTKMLFPYSYTSCSCRFHQTAKGIIFNFSCFATHKFLKTFSLCNMYVVKKRIH